MPMDKRLFHALPARRRHELDEAYIEYCYARFGAPDFENRSFAKREEFLAAFRVRNKPSWNGPAVAQTEFDRYYHGGASLDEAPPLVAWLVRMARSNAIEGWGVRWHLDRAHYERDFPAGVRPTSRALATMQELYHDELLREAVRLFGIEFYLHLPGRGMQQLFKGESFLPEPLARPLTLVSEIIGSVAFLDMRNRADELLAVDPAMLETVRSLIDEVIVDEIGHITALAATQNAANSDWSSDQRRSSPASYSGSITETASSTENSPDVTSLVSASTCFLRPSSTRPSYPGNTPHTTYSAVVILPASDVRD